MNFYYAVAGQQNGPVSEEQLDQMVASGTVSPTTLVWREGMETWQPYSTLKPGAMPSAAAPVSPESPGAVVCTVCRQSYPPEQVIRYGATPVCRNCQPGFIQSLPVGAQVSHLRYAGFWKRFLAKIIDTFAMTVVLIPILLLAEYYKSDAFMLLYNLLSLVLSFAYPIFFHGKWGQTLGKMALKIKVVRPDSSPIDFGTAALRTLAEILSGCILAIGYIMAAFDDEKRALHDRLANTRVIEID